MADAHVIAMHDIVADFVAGRVRALEFERAFLEEFSRTPEGLPRGPERTLQELFGAVESYVADESIRDAGDLDDEQLLSAARQALPHLEP